MNKENGLSISSFIFGLLSLMLFLFCATISFFEPFHIIYGFFLFVSFFSTILSILFACLGRVEKRFTPVGLTGLIISILLLAFVMMIFLFFFTFNAFY